MFSTASANLLRSKLRSLLTILAIFIGAFTLTLTNGLGAGVSSYIDQQLGNLGQDNVIFITAHQGSGDPGKPQRYQEGKIVTVDPSNPSGSTIALTATDLKKLETLPHLSHVQPMLLINPDYIQGANEDKYKITFSQVLPNTRFDLQAGSQFSSETVNEIIIPEPYVKILGFSSARAALNQTVTVAVSDVTRHRYETRARIQGVLAPGIIGATGAIANNSLRQQLYRDQLTNLPPQAQSIYVAATGVLTVKPTDANVRALKASLKKNGFDGTTVKDQLGIFATVIRVLTYILNGFALIALLAAGFGIVNTLLMAVQERTREIGLMKAMGMGGGRIFTLFALEAVLLGLWGSLVGIGVGMGAGKMINEVANHTVLKELPGFALITFPAFTLMGIAALIMLIALMAGVLPALRAARLNPIDALRHE